MADATADFFESPTENSKVKAKIVAKYVQAWARIMSDYLRGQRRPFDVAYVDLFSGPGTYEDGTPSTPTIVLASVTRDPKLRPALRTYFNDRDPAAIASLQADISEFPGIQELGYQPQLTNAEASLSLVDQLNIPVHAPRLYFLDQFGYKHVTLEMIGKLLAGFGSECIFFFNYRRVIAAIENPAMVDNVRLLFGTEQRIADLRSELRKTSNALGREKVLLAHLVQALKQVGAKYVQPFSFRVEDRQRSTHHLIFVTKHAKGYQLMKDIMAREGTASTDGVPVMSYIQKVIPKTANLFDADPIKDLSSELLLRFQNMTLTVDQVFLQHSADTNFSVANYKTALLALEERKLISVNPIAEKRPKKSGKPTMAGSTTISFPGDSL